MPGNKMAKYYNEEGKIVGVIKEDAESEGTSATPAYVDKTSATGRVKRRKLTEYRHSATVLGLFGVAVACALWEVLTRLPVAPKGIPPFSHVIAALITQIQSADFWTAVGVTLEQWALGFAIAALISIPIGILLGSSETLWHALRPTVEFLRPMPGIALIPVAVLIWGLSVNSVVFLVVFGNIWPLTIQTMYGVRDVDDVARQTADSYRLTRAEKIRWLILPSALPFIATGLRIASAVALIIVVGTQLVAGIDGIGKSMIFAQTAGNTAELYGLILTAGIIGIIIHLVFTRIEHRVLHWHQSYRSKVSA